MQDFQSIPGLAGRIFSSGGGGGGGAEHRRMRGYPTGGQEPPAKCPRCDSVNTKFCYYNNYNLCQPRHFCKSCRRYWTKGGVLRNVPVGGGCRKSSSKRSSASKKPSSAGKDRRRPPASRSSSDSSSLTASTTDAAASAAASAAFPIPELFTSHPNRNPEFDPAGEEPLFSGAEIFAEAGSFTSLMASATPVPAIFGLSFSDPPPLRLPAQQQQQQQQKAGLVAVGLAAEEEIRMPGLATGFIDPVDVTPLQGRMNGCAGGAINGLDWTGAMDPGLFDLTSAVDPGAYWNQGHWGDTDPSLYLP